MSCEETDSEKWTHLQSYSQQVVPMVWEPSCLVPEPELWATLTAQMNTLSHRPHCVCVRLTPVLPRHLGFIGLNFDWLHMWVTWTTVMCPSSFCQETPPSTCSLADACVSSRSRQRGTCLNTQGLPCLLPRLPPPCSLRWLCPMPVYFSVSRDQSFLSRPAAGHRQDYNWNFTKVSRMTREVGCRGTACRPQP